MSSNSLRCVGDMKQYRKEWDNRSWCLKPDDRREHIIRFTCPKDMRIPLHMLHSIFKYLYGPTNGWPIETVEERAAANNYQQLAVEESPTTAVKDRKPASEVAGKKKLVPADKQKPVAATAGKDKLVSKKPPEISDQEETSPEKRPPEKSTPGKPSPEKLSGKPSPEKVPGKPSPEKLSGKPSPEKLSGKTSPEKLPGKPSPEKLPGKPSPEKVPGKPSPEKLPGKSSPEKLPGTPSPEKPTGKPSPEKLLGNVSPEKPTSEKRVPESADAMKPSQVEKYSKPEIVSSRKDTPSTEKKAVGRRVSIVKDAKSFDEDVPRRADVRQVKVPEVTVSEVGVKKTRNKETQTVAELSDSDRGLGVQGFLPPEDVREEEEEVFLDAHSYMPERPVFISDEEELPCCESLPDYSGAGEPRQSSPCRGHYIYPEKKSPCEVCDLYFVQCCKYEYKVENLCTYSSALENRCEDYDKVLQSFSARLTATKIIIKHLQEKNNQLLQKWAAIHAAGDV